MALWSGSTINSNETAMVFNKLYSMKSVNAIRQKNGLLYAILGKQENGATPGVEQFERLEQTTGKNIEVRALGRARTVSTYDYGSSELATANISSNYQSDVFGGTEFKYTHFADVLGIPASELVRFAGQEAKTASYIDELFEYVITGLENTMGNQLTAQCATSTLTFTTGTTTQLCSIFNVVSDGVSTYTQTTTAAYYYPTADTQYKVWGTIDRSDSGNSMFRSAMYGGASEANAGTGTLSFQKLYTLMNRIIANGGMPGVGVCDATIYGILQNLSTSMARVNYDEEFNKYGGVWMRLFGINFIMDQRVGNTDGTSRSSGSLFLLDPSTWRLYRQDQNLTTSGIVVDPSRVSAYVLPYGSFTQLICANPSHNGKMIGITG